MATYTSNYGWTKPSGSDNVDISVLNDNLDDQDSTIHDAFLNMAPPFSESATYAVDDIVLYGTGLYKCHTAVVTPGSWTGWTNWQVYKLSEGGSGGGGTSNYNQLTNKPSINGVTLTGNKTTSDLGIDKTAVGLGNVPNVSTNDQTPTFTEASTRNNIASGEKLSVIFGKIQKFFNDLKTVAFSGSYTDLSNKPQVNGVELSGNKTASQLGMANSNTFQGTIAEWNALSTTEKKAYDHASITGTGGGEYNVDKTTGDLVQTAGMPDTYPADQVMMSDGTTSVEDALDEVKSGLSTLLWTNPTNELAPQTITLTNLQEYRYIDVVHSLSHDVAIRNVSRFKVANGTNNLFIGRIDTSVSSTSVINTLNFTSRAFTINGNDITFESGQMTYNNGVYKDWNNRCVPLEIYGIKY